MRRFFILVSLFLISSNAFANAGWPALLISAIKFAAYRKFWFIIVCSLIIELLCIKYILKFPWKKSVAATAIGNLASAGVGIFIPFLLYPVDYLTQLTIFSAEKLSLVYAVFFIDILLTFALTLGTEIIIIRYIYKVPWKSLLICLSAANLMTNILPWVTRFF